MKTNIKFLSIFAIAILLISCKKENNKSSFVCGDTITDIDGNTYKTVSIGGQCWMQENLKTSKYNDGTAIATDLPDATWKTTTTGAYTIYDAYNIFTFATNNATYGKLYNWYAVNTGKLAPKGWHVPTDAEWTTLTTFLGGANLAGDKMKANTLWTPYAGITNTNSSYFNGLPGGYRKYTGTFLRVSEQGYFWSSDEFDAMNSTDYILKYSLSDASKDNDRKNSGCSVRCIKD